MRENRFQTDVAMGKFTLPIVVFVCLLLWLIGGREWSEWGSAFIVLLTGYLMIEMNTTFTLIRTRTTLPVCFYWMLLAALMFLHPFEWSNWVPLAFLMAVFRLFYAYESASAPTAVFQSFLCLGLGSLVFPQLLYFVPLFWGGMISFRALSAKSFFACLLGLSAPYWFLFGYAFLSDELPLFLAPLQEMLQVYPIDYGILQKKEIVAWAVVTLLLATCCGHYIQVAYQDKTRTRLYLSFLAFAGGWATLFSVLQPCHLHSLLPIQLLCASFLAGHLFTLTRNRFSAIFFIVTFITIIILTLYQLWMLFFNS